MVDIIFIIGKIWWKVCKCEWVSVSSKCFNIVFSRKIVVKIVSDVGYAGVLLIKILM